MYILIHTAHIMGPSFVSLDILNHDNGLIRVSWTPPENLHFDIDYYCVRIYINGTLYTTSNYSGENFLNILVPSGDVNADVSVVSKCGTESPATQTEVIQVSSGLSLNFFCVL